MSTTGTPCPVILWQDPHTVNVGNTTGQQFIPTLAGLADGRYIIAWVDDTNNVDSSAGTDIIAQYFDALGNPDGNAFQLNDFGVLDQETDAEIQALNTGGFVVAYEQNANDGDTDILWERYGASGDKIAEGAAALGAAGASQVRNPTIASGNNFDTFAILFDRTDLGNTDLRGVSISQPGNVQGSEYNAGQNSTDFDRRPDSAGNPGQAVFTVYEEADGATTSIEYFVTNIAGAFIAQGTIAASGEDPHVAALSGNSGFVVTWTEPGGGIYGQVRSGFLGDTNEGTFTVADFAADNEHSSDVVGLLDGGFFVVWYDSNDDRIEGRRFDSGGNFISNQIIIENGTNLQRPELSLLSDGRVVVAWENSGDIRSAIVDVRDDVINGTTGNDVLTSRPDGATVNGFSGDDQIFGRDANDILNGSTGNDEIVGGGGDDTINGGGDDDILEGGSGDDDINGGSGNDTVIYRNETSGVEVRLNSGTATGASAGSDTLSSIENVEGSEFDDLIFGNDLVNIINGYGGNDEIFALGENDIVNGGDGNDTLNGNLSDDELNGDAGDDTVLGAQGNDTLSGGDDNDIVSGGAGNDTLSGGNGDDEVLGGGDNDILFGDAGNDTLSAGSGNDTASGGDDNDLVLGAGGDDTLFGDGGIDTVSGGAGNDIVDGGDGDDMVFGADGDDTSVSGGAGNDTVSGGTGNDNVFGRSGNDNVLGASGDDRLDGGTDTDILTGGTGFDTFVFGVNYGDDTVQGFEDDIDTLELNDALWAAHGNLTATEVVNMFSVQTSPGIVDFTFDGGETLRVVNGSGISQADLIDDIAIV